MPSITLKKIAVTFSYIFQAQVGSGVKLSLNVAVLAVASKSTAETRRCLLFPEAMPVRRGRAVATLHAGYFRDGDVSTYLRTSATFRSLGLPLPICRAPARVFHGSGLSVRSLCSAYSFTTSPAVYSWAVPFDHIAPIGPLYR